MTTTFGPQVKACDLIHAERYRARNEDFRSAMTRIASALADGEEHFTSLREILLNMRFMPAGRIQSSVGSTKAVSPYNCFVSGTIDDSFVHGHGSIMHRATEAATTMRLGGGIGYDFSTLRPRGELIKKLESGSTGAVSFMDIFDSIGRCTAGSGHRRGAQMGVLRVDHPDIEEFIRAKQNTSSLTSFNISVAVTDEFMRSVAAGGGDFDLKFNGRVYKTINSQDLWKSLMRSTYDWSEPGVLFIDRINEMNNLYYCEVLAATNPCGEQPLPPYGACLLGSFNLPRYLYRNSASSTWKFNYRQFFTDVPHVVRAMDNVISRTRHPTGYPLHEQEQEANAKRRMGLGVCGAANAIEAQGPRYGSFQFIETLRAIMAGLRDAAYRASAELAKEKGAFPLFERNKYLESRFLQTLPDDVFEAIEQNGIRNSHLLSIAPTGTISVAADNISSGIEPVFDHRVMRTVNFPDGPRVVELEDYGVRYLQTYGKTSFECSPRDHLAVLACASEYVDSAVSKTCNLPQSISWDAFQDVYMAAWKAGAKGCTTFRLGGMRGGIIASSPPPSEESKDVLVPTTVSELSCSVDPATGLRSCE